MIFIIVNYITQNEKTLQPFIKLKYSTLLSRIFPVRLKIAETLKPPTMLLQSSSTFLNPIPILRTPHLHCYLPVRPYIIVRSAVTTESTEQQTPPPVPSSALKFNKFSSRITEPKSQGGSQAILYGVGLNDDDMVKPQVGISSVWYEGNTCNMHLMELSEAVKKGVYEAGMVGFRFNTIGVSDAISMGTRGMCYSLQSRDLIADSVETVMSAQWYDANISIPGCDKNVSLSTSFICLLF